MVGTQGIDGDEEDVGLGDGGGRQRLGAEGGLGEYAGQNKDEDKKNGESFHQRSAYHKGWAWVTIGGAALGYTEGKLSLSSRGKA